MSPEDVLRNADLADHDKVMLLCQMAYDAAELAVATDEGMPDDGSDLQRRVLLALHQLHRSIDVEHTAPTKQHAACLRQFD
jgi:hypothetical protein